MLTILSLILSVSAHAFMPPMETFSSPASLKDFAEWAKTGERFNKQGSETLAYRSLVEVLYYGDLGLWEYDKFFPEATDRLRDFRSHFCKAPASLPICALPDSIEKQGDLVDFKGALIDQGTIDMLSARWKLKIIPWQVPNRFPDFSLVVGPEGPSATSSARLWEMPALKLNWTLVRYPLIWDIANHQSGMKGSGETFSPAIYILQDNNTAVLSDWVLRDRAMELAHAWKYAIDARARWMPSNPVIEGKEFQFYNLFKDESPAFERIYNELLAKVSGSPEFHARFLKEKAKGGYPEEVYQHLAYERLLDLVQVQAAYFSLATEKRQETSPRQQALESLLSLQRYASAWRFFLFDLSSLMEPITGRGYVLDQMADYDLATVFVFDQLKAVLGMGEYEGKALFPAIGKSLLDPELLKTGFLEINAPDILELLKGPDGKVRTFDSLPVEEQLSVLRKFLSPAPGKYRPMSIYRMAILLYSGLSEKESHQLADTVHEMRKKNFK